MHEQPDIYTIGGYTLDRKKRLLSAPDNSAVSLRKKTYDVLAHLVDHANEVNVKENIISAVWKDTVVTDDSLVQCIAELRRKLGDSDKKIIKTVPRLGYILNLDSPVDSWQVPVPAAGHPTHPARKTPLYIAACILLLASFLLIPAVQYPHYQPGPTSGTGVSFNFTHTNTATDFQRLHAGYFADNKLVHKRLTHKFSNQSVAVDAAGKPENASAATHSRLWQSISNREYGYAGTKFWTNGNIWSGYEKDAPKDITSNYSIIKQGTRSSGFQ